MKNFIHTLGIHNWKYEVPTSEKIKERVMSGIFHDYDMGKTWSGYAYFQKRNCLICGKSEIKRI